MDDDLASARRARMRWNTPLSTVHADVLLDRLNVDSVAGIVDIGCGWGELLLRAVERTTNSEPATDGDSAVRGVGVDNDPVALERGRALARRRGLEGQVEFVLAEAAAWSETAERALCVGSSHAFGGSRAALEALAALVPRGGRLLSGDGCWPGPTTTAALDIFGDQVLPLPELVDASRAAGWRVIHLSVADQREWDAVRIEAREHGAAVSLGGGVRDPPPGPL